MESSTGHKNKLKINALKMVHVLKPMHAFASLLAGELSGSNGNREGKLEKENSKASVHAEGLSAGKQLCRERPRSPCGHHVEHESDVPLLLRTLTVFLITLGKVSPAD